MKKKILVTALFLFAAVAMAFGLLACITNTNEYNDSDNITGTDGSDTDGAEGGGRGDSVELYYSLNDDKVSYSVMGYGENFGGDVEIPEMYESFPVTSIAASAFYNCTTLTSVVLSNSITSVGVSAFKGCTSLVNVTIGEKVTYIGSSAFSGCSSLESLTLPFAGERAAASTASASTLFGYVFGTSSYNGGSAVQQFYSDTLYETYYIPTSLTSVTITSTDVLPGAFNNCDKIPSIILGDGVTFVGDYAFYGCSSLTDVSISEGLVSVGDFAFGYCTSLVTISIPKSVESLGNGLFAYCMSLKHVEFLNDGLDISEDMFYCCESLEDLSLPENVAEIGSFAYYGCTGLRSVTVSGNAVVIGNDAFCDCTSLASVVLDSSVSKIGEYVFCNCSSLVSVTICYGVDSIGSYAFCNCVSVMSISVPSSVTTIGESAFSGCSSLESMTLPFVGGDATAKSSSESTLFGYIFGTDEYDGGASTTQYYLNYVSSITYFIPEGLTSVTVMGGDIMYGSFWNCIYLSSVTIGEDAATTIGSHAFYGCMSVEVVTIGKQVTSISNYAFYGCTALTEINFNAVAMKNLSSGGNCAFSRAGQGTTGVTVTIGSSVTKIPANLFYSDPGDPSNFSNNIESVVFESGSECEEIGEAAFRGCTSLTSVIVPDSVIMINQFAFYGCTSLTSLNLGVGLTWIAYGVFGYCTSLTSVIVPDFVTMIVQDAFCECTSLTSLKIGASVEFIDVNAFRNCTSLTSVYFSGDASQWSGIYIGSGNGSLTYGATIYYYSETEPEGDGNFWYYKDGEIVVWD